ncbi:hypothetical protein [Rubritalea tangerina]|uniref:hypothetical protein n=1 Tax=Rubritalea tangerina TaxID=430798 RepID=UPI00361151BA
MSQQIYADYITWPLSLWLLDQQFLSLFALLATPPPFYSSLSQLKLSLLGLRPDTLLAAEKRLRDHF